MERRGPTKCDVSEKLARIMRCDSCTICMPHCVCRPSRSVGFGEEVRQDHPCDIMHGHPNACRTLARCLTQAHRHSAEECPDRHSSPDADYASTRSERQGVMTLGVRMTCVSRPATSSVLHQACTHDAGTPKALSPLGEARLGAEEGPERLKKTGMQNEV